MFANFLDKDFPLERLTIEMPSQDWRAEVRNTRAEAQRQLVEFLCTELSIADTLAHSAVIARDSGHIEHYERAKGDAEKAQDAIKHFLDHVKDEASRSEMQEHHPTLSSFRFKWAKTEGLIEVLNEGSYVMAEYSEGTES